MTLAPVEFITYYIKNVFTLCVNNWVLSIPIAMFVIYAGLKLLTRLFKLLKKGGN